MCIPCGNQQAGFWIAGYYSDHIDIMVQNASGLASISVAEAINCTVSIPTFATGTTDPVEVTATKVNLGSGSRVVLQACAPESLCDQCCDQGDPVLTHLEIPAQESSETILRVKETFNEIPRKESYISIQNGARGLKRLRIKVNDETFDTLRLKDGQEKFINVASMMEEGENRITLIGYGEAGAKALILISDIAVNDSGQSSDGQPRLQRHLLWEAAQRQPGQNLKWGR